MEKVYYTKKKSDIIDGRPIITIYIVYKTTPKTISSSFVLKNCLFGAVKITSTTISDPDKCQYSGCGIGFDSKGKFMEMEDIVKMLFFFELV